jgi:hypothetical protein
MELLNFDIDKVVQNKAIEIYREICVKIVENNGLKEKALELCDKLCDMHIINEKDKCSLFSYQGTWENIKRDIRALINEH